MSKQQDQLDNLLRLSQWDSTYPSHAWQALPADLLGEIDLWGRQHQQGLNDGTITDPQIVSGASNAASTSTDSTQNQDKKRQRIDADDDGASEGTTTPTLETINKAREQLNNCQLQGVDMTACGNLACDDRNLYAIAPMGPDPLDYFGGSLRTGEFQARVVVPVFGKDLHNWTDMPAQMEQTVRPPGKSLHLVFTRYPDLDPSVTSVQGFALLTVCRRGAQEDFWEPQCFVTFEDPDRKPQKLSGSKIGFIGNLDRCIGVQNGKRIWGQRTSHVRHSDVRAKPMRVAPKGSTKSYRPDDNFGYLMSDVHGHLCIARTNPFRFEEKRTDSTMPQLLGMLDKLTVSQRVSLATSAPDRDTTNLLLSNASETQIAAGLMSAQLSDQLPSTACPLSAYMHTSGNLPSSDYKSRLQSVARWMGFLHANEDLWAKHSTYLKSGNITAARGRFMALVDTDLDEHQQWLASEGVSLKASACSDRAQILGSIMAERKYKSHCIVCVFNIYPDSVMVDQLDESIVYCLAEEGRESSLELCDRLLPLARIAFTSRLQRQDIQQVLLEPYRAGFEATYKGNEQAIFLERFWLLLHAMRLDFFLYWIKFRNADACRRIQASLFEDDEYFDSSFFGPDRFKRLKT